VLARPLHAQRFAHELLLVVCCLLCQQDAAFQRSSPTLLLSLPPTLLLQPLLLVLVLLLLLLLPLSCCCCPPAPPVRRFAGTAKSMPDLPASRFLQVVAAAAAVIKGQRQDDLACRLHWQSSTEHKTAAVQDPFYILKQ
jgi:hypothetical protein